MRTLITVEGYESDYKFVGGGFGDTGFRTVHEPYREIYLVEDFDKFVEYINVNHIKEVREVSEKEFAKYKVMFDKYIEAAEWLIEKKEREKAYEKAMSMAYSGVLREFEGRMKTGLRGHKLKELEKDIEAYVEKNYPDASSYIVRSNLMMRI